MGKDDHKEAYKRGKQAAKEAGLVDEVVHGLSETVTILVPKTDEAKAEKAGWKNGMDEKSKCFITTASIEANGLTDDCYELNTLRAFRDEYVRNLPNGDQIVREYYETAPRIIAGINEMENSREIYLTLYEHLVTKSLNFIHSGEKVKAFMNYLKVVNELKKRYL